MDTSSGFRGTVFDVEGVLVNSPHEQAWCDRLQQLMENNWGDIRGQTSYTPKKFTSEVYQKVMSGKPRYVGAQAAKADDGDLLEGAQAPGDRWDLLDAERRVIRLHPRTCLTG